MLSEAPKEQSFSINQDLRVQDADDRKGAASSDEDEEEEEEDASGELSEDELAVQQPPGELNQIKARELVRDAFLKSIFSRNADDEEVNDEDEEGSESSYYDTEEDAEDPEAAAVADAAKPSPPPVLLVQKPDEAQPSEQVPMNPY